MLQSRKVNFFLIYLIFPTALGPGVYPASNRNEYQKQENNVSDELRSRARPVRKGDLTAICEPTVYAEWDPQHLTAL
jgi:hypothetical protein